MFSVVVGAVGGLFTDHGLLTFITEQDLKRAFGAGGMHSLRPCHAKAYFL